MITVFVFAANNTGLIFHQMFLIRYLLSSLVDLKFFLLQISNKTLVIEYGVPQGSALGSLFYSCTLLHSFLQYPTILVLNVICMQMIHKFTYRFLLASSDFSTILSCIRDAFAWMTSNMLSVYPNEIVYLQFNPNNINLPVNIINLGLPILYLLMTLQKTLM